MRVLLIFLLISLSFSKTITYDVYVLFFKVGEIKIKLNKNYAYAEGRTVNGWELIYSYNFKFIQEGKKLELYEKEKGKERIYKGKKVIEKKPWIPLIVEYLQRGKVEKTQDYRIVEKENRIEIYPKKSKRLKKVYIYGSRIPERIEIYGKVKIILKLRNVKED